MPFTWSGSGGNINCNFFLLPPNARAQWHLWSSGAYPLAQGDLLQLASEGGHEYGGVPEIGGPPKAPRVSKVRTSLK